MNETSGPNLSANNIIRHKRGEMVTMDGCHIRHMHIEYVTLPGGEYLVMTQLYGKRGWYLLDCTRSDDNRIWKYSVYQGPLRYSDMLMIAKLCGTF